MLGECEKVRLFIQKEACKVISQMVYGAVSKLGNTLFKEELRVVNM
jgi:hypothetical protein